MATPFTARLAGLIDERNTILCIGLDPALPEQRRSQVIPQRYLSRRDENERRLAFCLDIIEDTSASCCVFKPNQQYLAGFRAQDHLELTGAIRKAGALSILDYKLNDIGDTMESALFHIGRWGYDAITFNPFLGNMEKAVTLAHGLSPALGLIVLTLTSNPEAIRYQKEAFIDKRPVYQVIALDVKRHDADGCVVGATGHITEDEMRTIRAIIGEDKVLLIPGIGAQKGDPQKALRAGGKLLLINVGREIIYSESPHAKAEEYSRLFNAVREHL
jgi:orotidine 5'-phosphate decarboxylase subfamily 2